MYRRVLWNCFLALCFAAVAPLENVCFDVRLFSGSLPLCRTFAMMKFDQVQRQTSAAFVPFFSHSFESGLHSL